MKNLRIITIVGVFCLTGIITNASTNNIGLIRDAVNKSADSLRSGYGFFIAAHIPPPAIKEEAGRTNPTTPVPPPTDYRLIARSCWTFSGQKWRFDSAIVFPQEQTTGEIKQFAWDGTNATAAYGGKTWTLDGVRRARQRSMLDMNAPLTTGEDRQTLNDPAANYVGDDQINGQTTPHVNARIGSVTYDLWLSPSHGYQTQRMRRTPDNGLGGVSDYRVLSFKQYDGVWMPESIEELRFEQKEGQFTPPDVRRFRTLEFHPNASIAADQFQFKGPAGSSPATCGFDEVTKLIQRLPQDELNALLKPAEDPKGLAKPAKAPETTEKRQ